MTISDERDIYGGWTGRRFDATGFFRLGKADRWRFVSPKGNAFFAFGVNHVQPWCGWVDSWVTHQKGRQHSGIQGPFGNCYEPLRIAMCAFASRICETGDGVGPT